MTKLDAKFYGEIRKVKDDSILDDGEWMVFLARDDAFALLLPIYFEICRAMGADYEHLEAVNRTIRRMQMWRETNLDRCHVPGAKGEKLLDQ